MQFMVTSMQQIFQGLGHTVFTAAQKKGYKINAFMLKWLPFYFPQ